MDGETQMTHARARASARCVLGLVLCVVALAATASAAGAPKRKPGLYYGKVENSASVIVFTATRKQVKRIVVSAVRTGCSNGAFFPLSIDGDRAWASSKIKRERFSVTDAGPGFDGRLEGKLTRIKASGTLRIQFRYNETTGAGAVDPNGSILCDTGTLKWKARLKVDAR
jgi:hypothetical protein